MNEETLEIRMPAEDRDLILKHAFPTEELQAKLRFGLREGKFLVFTLDWHDAEDLAECVAAEANNAKNRKIRRKFERLSGRIEALLEKKGWASDRIGPSITEAFPEGMRGDVEEKLASRKFGSLDELNAELRRKSDDYNQRPQEDFLGLSPEQVGTLLYTEWDSPDAGMQYRKDLSLKDIKNVEIFHNARTFLSALQAKGPTKATEAGNLNRKFVCSMVDAMRWPDGFVEDLWRFNKVLNEEDVMPLHALRIVLEDAGYIRRRKNEYLITKEGTVALEDVKAGELFASLFRVFFTRFNLAYADRLDEYPEVQQTIRYSLYALRERAQEWQKLGELAPAAFLPSVVEGFNPGIYTDTAELVLGARLLRPLDPFGLIECERETGKYGGYWSIHRVRITPLYDKFLRFPVI